MLSAQRSSRSKDLKKKKGKWMLTPQLLCIALFLYLFWFFNFSFRHSSLQSLLITHWCSFTHIALFIFILLVLSCRLALFLYLLLILFPFHPPHSFFLLIYIFVHFPMSLSQFHFLSYFVFCLIANIFFFPSSFTILISIFYFFLYFGSFFFLSSLSIVQTTVY